MSIDLLERAASVLGDICDEVVFVGAATIVLWVTDPAAPPLRALPSGASIRALAPPYLLAAKLEAFGNRGHADYLGSSDFADVVVLLDARAELVAEVAASPGDLRDYTATQLAAMITDARAINGLHGAMAPDAASQARVGGVLLPRMRLIIDSA